MNDITRDTESNPEDGHPTFDEAEGAIEQAYLDDLARADAYADFVETEALRLAEEDDADADETDPWTMGDQYEADGRYDR